MTSWPIASGGGTDELWFLINMHIEHAQHLLQLRYGCRYTSDNQPDLLPKVMRKYGMGTADARCVNGVSIALLYYTRLFFCLNVHKLSALRYVTTYVLSLPIHSNEKTSVGLSL